MATVSKDKKFKSPVWQYFTEPELKDGKRLTKCQLCNISLGYFGGTTSMRNHLQYKHPSVKISDSGTGESSLKPKKSGSGGFRQASALVGKQIPLTDMKWNRQPMSAAKSDQITRSLALMCALDARPLSIVEGAGFRNFVRTLNPDYNLSGRTTVTKYLHKIYLDAKAEVLDEIKGKPMSLTSDIWTSNALDGYISVTGHFIDDNWALKAKNLSTNVIYERHTGVHIAKAILDVTTDFKVDPKNIACLVTDNAANMHTASLEGEFNHLGCFAHTIQLAVEDGLKLPVVSKALGACRKLVAHFNQSVLATQALLKKQSDNEGSNSRGLKLIQDVATRWNSSFLMMKRLLLLRVPIYAVLYDDSVTKQSDKGRLDMKDSTWKVMEEIVPILEAFFDSTEVLGKEESPTGSQVYVLLHNLVGNLETSEFDSGVARDLKDKIRDGLTKRFGISTDGTPTEVTVQNSLSIMAMALDPRYKSLKILRPEHRDIVKEKILHEINQTDGNHVADLIPEIKQERPEGDEPELKRAKITECLMGDVVIDITNDTSVEQEIRDYFNEVVRIADPLEWWKVSQVRFPNLASLAKRYLTIPGTSIPSERVFSVAGLSVTKLRASLDPDTVNEILFLHKHMKKTVGQLQGKLALEEVVPGIGATPESDSQNKEIPDSLKIKQESGCANNLPNQDAPLPALPMLPSLPKL